MAGEQLNNSKTTLNWLTIHGASESNTGDDGGWENRGKGLFGFSKWAEAVLLFPSVLTGFVKEGEVLLCPEKQKEDLVVSSRLNVIWATGRGARFGGEHTATSSLVGISASSVTPHTGRGTLHSQPELFRQDRGQWYDEKDISTGILSRLL